MAIKILITAGPTWVPVDSIRVISNIATGQTGIALAEAAKRTGSKVTLILGPVYSDYQRAAVRILRFRYFNDLKKIIAEELSSRKYDLIIHSAAVSDFSAAGYKGKISSDKNHKLILKPLPKIVKVIRRLAPKAKLVIFKLESGVSESTLIQRARRSQVQVRADIVVANMINPYRAFIIDKEGKTLRVRNKVELVNRLLKITTRTYNLAPRT
ncbi:MAG: phosphopantothenoylcysteine decarboxylase [Candidatus Omnitrophota bacterium]